MLIALIPAYNPIPTLDAYIDELAKTKVFQKIVVVNDGSATEHTPTFERIKHQTAVILLEHTINQGKGAALKTGLNEITLRFPEAIGTVTIDADGQHSIQDACKVAKTLLNHPHRLIIGGRNFDQNTPARSALGNFLTRHLFKMITGLKVHDTQSGLRGIPAEMNQPLIDLESTGYAFELDMLMQSQHLGFKPLEIPITTIYLNHNQHSSFRPVLDSLRIYFVLFRFSIIAIMSALLDYSIFILTYYLLLQNVLLALICSRIFSISFNYLNVRKFAFKAAGLGHKQTLPKYLLLAFFSGLMAYGLIIGFMHFLGWQVVPAKITAEIVMFILNFFIQRNLIFKQ
jgi:glycosyltransferase involved in cell wall biosynthesis